MHRIPPPREGSVPAACQNPPRESLETLLPEAEKAAWGGVPWRLQGPIKRAHKPALKGCKQRDDRQIYRRSSIRVFASLSG